MSDTFFDSNFGWPEEGLTEIFPVNQIPTSDDPKTPLTTLKLFRSFSSKHVDDIYTDLTTHHMNIQATPLLIKYEEAIRCRFFNIEMISQSPILTYHQKQVLRNIFKAVRLFRLSRVNIITNQINTQFTLLNTDLIRCVAGYLC
jgi:hypothetical protein